MEAQHSCLTTGEQSGGQDHCQSESHHRGPKSKSPSPPHHEQQAGSPKPHNTVQQPKHSRRQYPERKRLRHQRQSVESDTALEHKNDATNAVFSSLSPGVPSSSTGGPTQNKPETQEGTPKQKRERKPQRPGKYVCTYCGRACAKPSVLQKHIRSHTGERPYPCAPCGFSFKTKSNLYKHRKSHTHRVKAGLALGEPNSLEEQVSESEDETRQLPSTLSNTEKQSASSVKDHETDSPKDLTGRKDDSYAVKKRLALRLSRGKQGPRDSSDEKASSLNLGSKGSTESGYFSRSESTEQSQDSPPNTSAKSYAEIILGKCGRLGHLQRMPRQYNQQPTGQEDKNIPFTVPKKQVIDHITKLITINEAVVDTSKIDRVKPRRFSLSRKDSSESQKGSSMKEPLIHEPKAGDLGFKTSGSITMGVPCEKFHHSSVNVEPPAGQTSSPLVRSHSLPSAQSSLDALSCGSSKFHSSRSFDERKSLDRSSSRRYGMLRRQPAIEIPLGAELTKEEHGGSHLFHPDSKTTVPDHKQSQPQPYECEVCGTGCKDWEGYKKHKQSLCLAPHPRNDVVITQMECTKLINHEVRAGASAMRKRRKEESFEFDDPSSPSLPSPAPFSGHCKDGRNVVYGGPRRQTLQTCSVIQHTSSFEKQESLLSDNQATEATKSSAPHEEYHVLPHKQPQQESTKVTHRRLVRQHNVQVPEILVTEDSSMNTGMSIELTSTAKQSEKPDEFQWPQRSPSLSQLPIEKLPPKKKRLRLAEVAQSSGESSFDSISLPRSPSQDSSASYASSRSTSFEESNRPDMDIVTSTSMRKSRAPQMLTVPGVHQHREMRRSASEQAPHDPQPSAVMAESRSKSFDYSCLSPERTAIGWRERRKCLLIRHTAIRDPDEEEEEQCNRASHSSPEHVSPSAPTPSQTSPSSVYCSRSSASPLSGETVLPNIVRVQSKQFSCQWKNIQLTGSSNPVNDALHVSPIHKSQPPQAPQSYPTHGPSGAARAHYLPMSTGLKLEIPLPHDDYSEVRVSHSDVQQCVPLIISSQELLNPVTSPAVAVRLQTDTLTLACAIYTTLSQATSPKHQERFHAVSHSISFPEAQRTTGSGGNKRMLSPSNSVEIHPELQQQQKRVKEEEEEREVGCVDKAPVDIHSQEVKHENQSCLPSVCTSVAHVGPSFPRLLSSTCNSWCYLNYTKPNPSTMDDQKPSVYSSWSTTSYNPNPPGLSSKTALSLLHCKQRLSPSIYTLSPISVCTTESVDQEDVKKHCNEVYKSPSYCRDRESTVKGQQSVSEHSTSNQHEEGEEEEKREEVQSHSSIKESPKNIWTSESASNKKHAEDCGFHLKRTLVPEKRACSITGSPPFNCKHCNISFTDKGHPEVHPDKEKDEEYIELRKSGHDEDGNAKNKDIRPFENKVSENLQTAMPDLEKSHPGSQPTEPEPSRSASYPPKDSAQKSSAKARRALFASRHLDASASGSSSTCSQTIKPSTPPRSLSPGPHQSPSPPSSLSISFLSPASPFQGLSTVKVHSLGSESSGPPGSLADTSGQSLSTTPLPGDEDAPAHISPHPTRLRGAQNLLSHLPLHSQTPSRAPNLLIPIGGIHMIQPRSLFPLYTLVSSPTAEPTGTSSWRLSDTPKGRPPVRLQHQDSLRGTSPISRATSPDHGN